MAEIWKPIPGLEGYYEASSFGRIRSLSREQLIPASTRSKSYIRSLTGRILKPAKVGSDRTVHGYLYAVLWVEHKRIGGHVHKFIALSFLGPRPEGTYVCHKDGNGRNCNIDNLYYGTPTENSADAKRHGTACFGERHGAAKLTVSDVVTIRALKGCVSQDKLARKFGVAQSHISRIINGHEWRSLGMI